MTAGVEAAIDEACRDVVGSVDGAVACGVVDLETGMLLGRHVGDGYPAALSRSLASAARDLFRGANVGRIEQMIRSRRGAPDDAGTAFQEVHATSQDCFHFAKALKDGRVAMILVTRKTANQGIGWAKMKSAIARVEVLIP